MANPYDKYLQRTTALAQKDPYLAYAKQRMASLSRPLQRVREQAVQSSYRSGMSGASQAQLYSNLQRQEIDAREQVGMEYQSNLQQYRAEMDAKISDIQLQKEMYDEQKKKQDEARRKGKIGAIVQGAGTLAGGIIGGIATAGSPAGIMAGTNIGAGVGTTASGFIQESPEQIIQGGVSVAGSIAEAMTIPAKKQAMQGLAEIAPSLDINGLNTAIFMLQSGDYKAFNEFVNSYKSRSFSPGSIAPDSINSYIG